jgi:VCBS repeat-containing protein
MQSWRANTIKILTFSGEPLNFVGKFEANLSSAHSGGHVEVDAHHGTTDSITIPDANLLFAGDFKRSGPDLILSKDGHDLVVEDYFRGANRAALASPDGAQLSGVIVDALTGHVQYAQADGGLATAKVIGHVAKLTGSATAIRNGVSIQLNVGDNVNKGDVVQAGADSSLGLTFIDGTVFGLSSNARMVLNDMVYDPNGTSNSSLLSLVQGTITFVAGETAKHGEMKVDTPVATMGIRGTAVLVEIDFQVPGQGDAPPVKFQVLVEQSGKVGSYFLYSKSDPNFVIGQVNVAGLVTAVSGNGNTSTSQAPPLSQMAQDIIGQAFSIANPAPPNPNPQGTGPIGSTPADPLKYNGPSDTSPHNNQPDTSTPPHDSSPTTPQNNVPPTNPINFIAPNTPPKIQIANVFDQTSFKLPDRVTITDPDGNDVVVPYLPGSGHIQSVVAQGTVPAGVNLVDLVTLDSQTGAVSYDPSKFAFLGEGQKALVIIDFASQSGNNIIPETLTLTIDGFNDPPVITAAALTVAEGGTMVLNTSDIVVADPDSTSFTFTVSNVAHGVFQTTSDGVHWIAATTFTTADLTAGHVRFLHDGSQAAPTFSISADDGASANNLSNVLAGAVDFTVVDQTPTIAVTNGGLAELAGTTGNAASDTASGTVNFTEANLADRPVVSTSFASFTYADAQHHDITPSLTATQLADIQAVETSLAVTPAADNTNNGSATWTYSLADSNFDFLAAGETLTLTYMATVDDGNGNAATTPLSVTIAGANDVAVVATGTVAFGAIGVALPTSALTPVGAAILTAPSGLVSGLGHDTGYGTLALAPGDDNSSGAIDLTSVFGAAGIDFFGTHYTSLYVNNNGNISFGAPNGVYTPSVIGAGFNDPIIAPFWADADTRAQGAVYYELDAADGVMTITWDQVGYYFEGTDKLDSFQIALINEGNGNFDIVYRYGQIQWTTGDASGGSDGLGGVLARAGYSAGDGVHYLELPQSGDQSALLALPTTPGNTGIAGVDDFQVRNGVVGPTTLTTSGTINFSDADLTDTHSIKSVTYTGGATQLGMLAVTMVSDTTGTGIDGQFAWTYTADTADVQSALLYMNDGSDIASFEVLIDDGHGGILTETVAVTLTASNADVWNGRGGDASWNMSGDWSLSHTPTADDVAYVDTATLVSLDVSHLSVSSVTGLHVSSQSEIELTASEAAGSFAVDGTLINQGTILLTDNTALQVDSAIHNSGTIIIDSATTEISPGATLLIDGTVLLDGNGTITLEGTNDGITGTYTQANAATLENVNNVIDGFGKLGDSHLHLINDAKGIIDATDPVHALIIDTGNTITNNGLLEATSGGTLVVDDAVTGTGSAAIGSGAQLEFGASVSSTGNVTFEGTTGTLKLDDPTHFAGNILGRSGSDGIDLAGFDAAHTTVTPVSTTERTVLTVTDENHASTAVSITLLGDYTHSTFNFSDDAHGGVLIVDPPSTPPPSTIIAATGTDQTLTGTGPSDNFVFNFANVGQAVVTNFHADSDLLELKSSVFAGAQAVLDATQDDGHGNAVIALDAHDSITLSGVIKAQLHQADFHLA